MLIGFSCGLLAGAIVGALLTTAHRLVWRQSDDDRQRLIERKRIVMYLRMESYAAEREGDSQASVANALYDVAELISEGAHNE